MKAFPAPRPIRAEDNARSFSSGNSSLDAWLRDRSLRNERDDASRTYVVIHDARIVAYYSLAAAAIPHAEATGRSRRNMPDPIPAMLLARLAVDHEFQGRQTGANLLRDAIRRTLVGGVNQVIVVTFANCLADQRNRHGSWLKRQRMSLGRAAIEVQHAK